MVSSSTMQMAATTVLVRAAADGMQLLLLRRSANASAFAGAYVFPGGRLDDADCDAQAWRRVRGLTTAQADRRLSVSGGALAFWIAAVRECYEEAGILLATDEHGQAISAQRLSALAARREALNAGVLSFSEFLEQENLFIPADQMVYFAHWVTPPVRPRRFDTRFLLMLTPSEQQVQHDNKEIVDSVWLSAREVLERVKRREMHVVHATQSVIASLLAYETPLAAVSSLRSVTSIPSNRPCFAQGREGRKMFDLGDAPYAEIHWVDRQESGQSSYDLLPDEPARLDRYATRLLAPNPGFMTGPGTNCYLVGESDLIVIDPGPADPAHIAAIVAAGGGRIRWIVLTHTHRDHAPAAMALREATGAPIAGKAGWADSPTDIQVPFDRVLSDGELVQSDGVELQVVHTPGHASNHLCYFLPVTRMLFTGDHVIQGSTVVIAPPDGNMNAYLRSLRRAQSLDAAILAPGHGYLIGDPQAEISRLIAHRMRRESKVRTALQEAGGRATLELLLPRVYDDVPTAIHPVAVRSLRGHLEKMVEDGEVTLAGDNYQL
jgi:glyoxylase-like metal-dependent hydrolase (beta-lactamase superfamily II)/8-oxo-dGTP pyrophosphatase MutT (NUDIX family)